VYKSFFRRYAEGEFALQSWDNFWGLLALLAVRKCGRWRERFQAKARDVAAEVSSGEFLAREPLPEEAAALAETVEQVLHGLEPRERDMVMLSLQGYTVAEVSEQVGRTRRTVQRLLQRVRKRLERLQAEAVEGP
jgi:RNA polymerase sigma-70 factor (ECF subfamily)